MNRKNLSALSLVFLIIFLVPSNVLASFLVGVKQNDWAEYDVSFTGTPTMHHDAEWARMDIDGVDGTRINVTFTSLLSDGNVVNATERLDFETGELIDYFVIPAGLKEGDSFFSKTGDNITTVTIDEVALRTYAGAARTTISGTTPETLWYWDQTTGVLVEAKSVYPDFTLTTVMNKTGLWQPQILGIDVHIFYALVAVAVVVIVVIALLAIRQNRLNKRGRIVADSGAVASVLKKDVFLVLRKALN
jgi:hypothetical protein